MSAKEMFEKIGGLEEAHETTVKYMKDMSNSVFVNYQYSDRSKSIFITTAWTTGFQIDGRFSLENMDLIFQAMKQQLKEWGFSND